MSPPTWASLLKAYRRENPPHQGRLDLHNIANTTAQDAGLCPFPEELAYVRPKKDCAEDLFILASNTGEKTTLEVYFRRRPTSVAADSGQPPQDQVHVSLTLRDDTGNSYSFEETTVVPFKDDEYRGAGFAYEALQGNKIGRIKFRGYLQRNAEAKLVYVQIRFLCLYFTKVFDHRRLFDDIFLLKQLKNGSTAQQPDVANFGDLLEDKMEQLCQIKGTMKVECEPERELFFLGTVGRRFASSHPRTILKMSGFDVEGTGFQLGQIQQGENTKYLYGFASRRGENFKVLTKAKNIDLTALVDQSEPVELQVILEGKRKYRIEVLPYKGNSRLVKINGVEGMCFINVQTFDEVDTATKPSDIAASPMLAYVTNRNTISSSSPPYFEPKEPKDLHKYSPLVLSLDDPDAIQPELTGGKGASLAQLKRASSTTTAHWTVPNALIITTVAYDLQTTSMEQFDLNLKNLQADVYHRDDVERKCDAFVRWFSGEEVHENIRVALKAKMEQVFGQNTSKRTTSFAIRSSATTEDSSEMSAAGQMRSYLGVPCNLEAICRAVLRCWASQFAYVPVEYKRGYGQPLDCPMAVVIQEMISCDSAGVIFTADPLDGDERRLVITSNFGLGESVVSATAEPDTFTLEVVIEANSYQVKRKVGKIISKVIGKKSCVTRLCSGGGQDIEDGVRNEIFAGGSARQSLVDAEVIQLGEIALEIAAVYNSPRDIEWGLVSSSPTSPPKFFLFQSRPITNLDATFTDYELMHELDSPHLSEFEIYTRNHWGEVLPGAVSWMGGFFLSTEFLLARDLVKQGTATPADYNPYRPIMGCLFNQVMFNMQSDFVLALFNAYPESAVVVAVVMAFFGHHITDEDVLNAFRNSRERLKPNAKQKRAMLGQVWQALFKAQQKIPRLKREVLEEDRGNILFQMRTVPLREQVNATLRKIVENFEDTAVHNATLAGSTIKSMLLMKALKSGDRQVDQSVLEHDHNLLLSHCTDVVSAEVPNRLREIAKIIEDGPTFAAMSDQEALEVLQGKNGTEGRAVEAFGQFLRRHGHRGHREVDPLFPPLEKNPLPAVQVIKSLLKSSSTISQLEPRPIKSIDQLLSELQSPLSPLKRYLIKRWLLPSCQAAVGARETTKSILMKHQNQCREALWYIAQRMVDFGLLPEAELFFYLKFDEAVGLIEGERRPIWLWKAKQRRRLWKVMDTFRFDEFIKGFRMAPRPAQQNPIHLSSDSICLTGTAVTVGQVKGRVCVAQTIADAAGSLQPGDILLTYSTDIGWSPYFPLLSGIVTEIGGTISHGAVIAREFGIPCLIAVEGVTSGVFQTGDVALLDCKTASIVKVVE